MTAACAACDVTTNGALSAAKWPTPARSRSRAGNHAPSSDPARTSLISSSADGSAIRLGATDIPLEEALSTALTKATPP